MAMDIVVRVLLFRGQRHLDSRGSESWGCVNHWRHIVVRISILCTCRREKPLPEEWLEGGLNASPATADIYRVLCHGVK